MIIRDSTLLKTYFHKCENIWIFLHKYVIFRQKYFGDGYGEKIHSLYTFSYLRGMFERENAFIICY